MNSLERFIKFLQDNQDMGGFIGVFMSLPNQDKPELIVNIPESLISKITYYQNAYNPDLTQKANNSVKIIGYSWVLEFESLEETYIEFLEELS